MSNRYGDGFYGPQYQRCPECGGELERKITESKVAGRKYTRCYNCAPTLWMRIRSWLSW